jgi:Phospholipase_D-nuclease N-terminal
MSIGILLFLTFLAIVIGGTVLWIMTIIDCAKNEPSEGNEKIVWILVIIFAHLVGALIYRLVRRPERLRRYGR